MSDHSNISLGGGGVDNDNNTEIGLTGSGLTDRGLTDRD